MADSKYALTFRIFKAGTFIREETISQAVIKIGKSSLAHLELDDGSVARTHAIIEVKPDQVTLMDTNSATGTFVNGRKINKARLESGDEIKLGDTRIEVTIGPAQAGHERAPSVGGVSEQVAAPERASSPPAVSRPTVAPPAVSAPTIAPPPGMMAQQSTSGMAAPMTRSTGGVSSFDSDVPGAKAVEVAAMFGDSVVSVKHCMDPRGGKIKGATYGMFLFGAALMVLSAIAFARSVQNAEHNKMRFQEHIEVKQKAAYKFRETRLSLAYDWMAFGGAGFGLLAFAMGMLRVRNERVSPFYRIGQAKGVDFATDASEVQSADGFPLVAPSGDDFVLNVTSGMRGEVQVDNRSVSLSEANGHASDGALGAKQLSIPGQGRVRVEVGKNVFLITSVAKPRRYPVPFVFDPRLWTYVGSAAAIIVGFLILSWSALLDGKTLALEMDSREARITNIENKANEDDKPEDDKTGKDSNESGGTGTAMALESGKMGKKDSDRAAGQYRMEKTADEPQLAKKQAIEEARDVGISGLLRASEGSAFASLTGTADFSSGLDDANVYGGLLGDEAGEMQGGFGFGRSGVGQGGGGTGLGTIGTGRYGTIGHGAGTGSGYGVGSGSGGIRGRTAKVPSVNIGNPTSTGDLDKSIIRRYIRRKLSRIRHCYEKELLVKSNIKGTVVTNFQISPSGSVLGASARGVDPNVSGCVAGVIRSIQFPKPTGGGLVQVRYPFNFRTSGQ